MKVPKCLAWFGIFYNEFIFDDLIINEFIIENLIINEFD